jgi:cytochrome P450
MGREVVEVSYATMSPELRSLMAYEPNGSLAVPEPQGRLDAVRRGGAVVRWGQGIGFFSSRDVLAAARNPDIVSMEPESGIVLSMGTEDPLIPLHLDGPIHLKFRRLLDPLFTPRKMARLEPAVRTLADGLIDGFIDDGAVELHDAYCVPLPTAFFLTLFGLPADDAPLLLELKDRILKNAGTTMEEREVIGRQAGKELREHLRRRLDERRAEPDGAQRGDLLSELLAFEVDGDRLSDDQVVNLMHLLTLAGLDTVSGSLSCIFAWFATHPAERSRVVAHPDLLGIAIEELMRFECPTASSGARWAARDTVVNGVEVRKGELVYLCWATANLDPETFADPLQVDLERSPNPHLAFAAGTHRCLGSHLARVELRTAVDQFHRRIPEYEMSTEAAPVFEFFGMRLATRLPLVFDRNGSDDLVRGG